MDTNKLKEQAKSMIKGNLWTIWKPFLVAGAISTVISYMIGLIFNYPVDSTESAIADAIISLLTLPLSVGCVAYVLSFVRGKKYELKDVFSKMDKLVSIWAVGAIVGILCGVGLAFLIVPGIILALMFSMTTYILADGEDNIGEVLKKSAEIMKGHKLEYFSLCLSFVGWLLLSLLTFGILLIWVVPYMNITFALYYERIRK